ncbi:MAG TPA: ATP-binding protein [Solirubrobacteraceae bacterium]|jgi:signal transduction histidine kinase|nr:ATP-binding protein [Solirubrobacteraceae bacterium]
MGTKLSSARRLRWRLTAWVAGVLLVSAAAMFAVVYRDTSAQLRAQIDRDVSGDTGQLQQLLLALDGDSAHEIAVAVGKYVHAQPFKATSTLLFVLVPGAGTVSNHPELFGSPRPEPGESAAEQAHENAAGRQLTIPRIGYSTHRLPDVGDIRVLERSVAVGKMRVVVGAGEPLAIVDRAERGIARAFLLAGALILAIALIASYLAGARVSAPLRRMATIAARVDAGDLEPRMPTSDARGDEVRVLADAFNHMLDRLADAFKGQRAFIADASHELRTPLTVIRGQLEVLAAQEQPPGSEVRRVERLVQAEVARIGRLVDDLLVLAQSEQTNFLRLEPIDLVSFVEELWDGITLTAERRFELGTVPSGSLLADPDRLAQALRNLANNAIEHTAEPDGLVRLEVERLPARGIRFSVIDDGPGIPPSESERVFDRFHRMDPARTRAAGGAGLGLAIVRAIADAHGGRAFVRARSAAVTGARVELELPGFTPARPAPTPDISARAAGRR